MPQVEILISCDKQSYRRSKRWGSSLQPHQRWATGLLFDNCTLLEGGMDFLNRGVAGSGDGWTMGWGVAPNIAKTYIIQNPPGAANWAIGNIGSRLKTARLFDSAPILEEGYFDSHGTPVAPQKALPRTVARTFRSARFK